MVDGIRMRSRVLRRVVGVAAVALVAGLAGPGVAPMAAQAAASDVAPFRSPEAFVRQQYTDFHGRGANINEVAPLLPPLQSGSKTAAAVVDQIAHQSGAADRTGNVTRLYTAYFLRTPDISGLGYWVGKSRSGWTLNKISANFAGSSEFKTKYGSLTNAAFVTQAYQNVFGRAPDASGKAYWTGKLDRGTSRGVVMVGFSQSNEYQRKQQSTCEMVLAYSGLLRRVPTGQEAADGIAVVADHDFATLAAQLMARPAYPARFPAPGAPGTVGASGGDKQAVVTWGAAAANGLPLAGYVVRPYVGAVAQADRVVGPTATSATITGLSNGTTYTFAVFAFNAAVDGPATTSASVKVTPEVVWSTFQGNAAHTGEQPNGVVPAAPTMKWKAKFGGRVLQTVVGDGHVFVLMGGSSPTAEKGARVYALDPTDGTVDWGPVGTTGDYIEGYLGYENKRVFLDNGKGLIKALSSSTGLSLWSANIGGYGFEQRGVTTYNGSLYAFNTKGIVAIDTSTGQKQWQSATTMNNSGTLAVNSTGVYVAQVCNYHYRFSLAGAKVWSTSGDCTGGGGGDAALSGGKAWMNGFIDPPVIREQSSGAVFATPAMSAPPAISGSRAVYNNGSTLEGVDWTTGAVSWSRAGVDAIVGSPVINAGRAWAHGEDGYLYGFNLVTGAPTATIDVVQDVTGETGRSLDSPELSIGDGIVLAGFSDSGYQDGVYEDYGWVVAYG